MASKVHKCRFLIILQVCILFLRDCCASGYPTQIHPFICTANILQCSSYLYQHNNLTEEQITEYYSISISEIQRAPSADSGYLVKVPCFCQIVNGTVGYFYDTVYTVQQNDTFANVSDNIYSGQAWKVGGEEISYRPGVTVTIHLPCGCLKSESVIVVTYTVLEADTLPGIAVKLYSDVDSIVRLNPYLAPHPTYLEVGWILYVPMQKNGVSR